MRPICPTAAAACSSCSACGRRFQPSRCTPSAIAPLDTRTTSRPCSRSAAICCAQRASATRSSPRPSFVTRLLPTLTTRRFALLTTERMPSLAQFLRVAGASRYGALGIKIRRAWRGAGGHLFDLALLRLEMIHDGVDELTAAFAGERGDHKRFTLPSQPAHEGARVLVSGVFRQNVDFVQHEPAWLAIECLVVLLELGDDRLRILHWIPLRVEGCDIDEVQQQSS